ncbi:MAG: DinB family protein [Gemmatimonadaceae bacterium]
MKHRLAIATIAMLVAGRPMVLRAQDGAVPNRESALETRKFFMTDLDTLQSKFLALANALPAEKYSWRPAPGVRSVGEVFMHVASEYYVFAPMAYGAARSPVIPRGQDSFKKFESASTKQDVLKHLNEGFEYAKQSISGIDPSQLTGSRKLFGGDHTIVETSFIMTDDLHEHLGQLIAYARMNGVTPPWSK